MLMDGRPIMTATDCMEAFRANRQPISQKKFWSLVDSGDYWFVKKCAGTPRKRSCVIYVSDFIQFMHEHGVAVVLPFEIKELKK